MLKKWLSWINYGLGGLVCLLFLGALFLSFTRPSEVLITDPSLTKRTLPPGAFAMPKAACDAIEKTFELKFSPPTIQLPDLRNQLTFYGKNGRPDAQQEKTYLHFAFLGNPTPFSVLSGERLYLVYDNKKVPGQCAYVLSPNNAETPIWLEATSPGSEAIVLVRIKNENGEIVKEPSAHAQFSLPEKEFPRGGNKVWEIGKWRIDGSLLARQKARWTGPDVFLERHGGEEYKDAQGRHRIEFSDDETTYSVFVGLNDSMIFDNDRWKAVQPGKDSREFPLMIVKKIDERLMNFELWDVGGKNKIVLNLLKSSEPWPPQSMEDGFKFLGARTRSQYIFEINNERMYLSPKDWLLQTKENEWIKLDSADLIDQYVERKITGTLFVFDGVEFKDNTHVLMGVMFNASRSDMQPVEVPIKLWSNKKEAKEKKEKEDDAIALEDDEDEPDNVPVRSRVPETTQQLQQQMETNKQKANKKAKDDTKEKQKTKLQKRR